MPTLSSIDLKNSQSRIHLKYTSNCDGYFVLPSEVGVVCITGSKSVSSPETMLPSGSEATR